MQTAERPPSTLPEQVRPVDPAQVQAERLAWLFRTAQPGGHRHPLLLPVACLRDAPAQFPAVACNPPTGQPLQPRHTADRDWLCADVAALPALPQAVLSAIALLQDETSTTHACADAVAADPAIAAQVLRLANAAAYGRSGRVGCVHDAIALLGRRTAGAMLTAAAVTARFRTAHCPGFDLPAFWRTAVASGIAAQTLALELGVDSGLAFTGGLLHDLGRLVMVARLPAAMGQALAWARLHDQPLEVAEHEVLGIDHAEVGALVAQHWQLPPALVAAIGGHHGTALAANPDHQALCDLVQAADAIVHALDLHHAEDERVPMLAPDLAERLDLTPARCARALTVTEQGVASLAEALAL
jgi:putative nucleotidyltransferase with HDIG domain